MANRDINLFKAAGGERAKGSKRSPMTYMVMLAILVVVVVVAVLLYFNLVANNALAAYEESEDVGINYSRTKIMVKEIAAEFNQVDENFESAKKIADYTTQESFLYPKLTEGEIQAIHDTILDNQLGIMYSVNDVQPGEVFTPWDYSGLRASLYPETEEESESVTEPIQNIELFYPALEKLAEAQKKSPKQNVWYTYFRCYLAVVFKGGDGEGLSSLGSTLLSNIDTMQGQAPFLNLTMNDDFYYDGQYTPAKYLTQIYNDEAYNIVLLPIKTVIERAYDILGAVTNSIVTENGWESQLDLAAYSVDDIHFTNERLSFQLTLPTDASFKRYMDAFNASVFFKVNPAVKDFGDGSVDEGLHTTYSVILDYKAKTDDASAK